MHRFDYSEITETVPAELAVLVRKISEIRSMESIRADRYREDMEKVRQEAMLSSITCSNRMEGVMAEPARIAELVVGRSEPLNRDEERIAGFGDALHRVNTDHRRMDFDARSIASLHRIMMSRGRRMGGAFRAEAEESVIQMCSAYSRTRAAGAEPLFLIPCAVFDLLSIGPFHSGNESVARLVTSMLLLNEGMDVCGLVPMEARLCIEPGEYHKAFSMSSEGWKENDWTYVHFIRFFLETLLECYTVAERRFPLDGGKRMKKCDRILKAVAESPAPVTKNEICAMLPDVSRRTADAVLTRLVSEGRIVKKGTFRDAKYSRQ